MEISKTIWGSSTRALEQARPQALTKTYDKPFWDCVRAANDVVIKKKWIVFKKDEVKGYMVIMGVPGAVNTTEIGVFFVEDSEAKTRLEVASLSTSAKRIVAKALFKGMDVAFGLAQPEAEPEPTITDDESDDQQT